MMTRSTLTLAAATTAGLLLAGCPADDVPGVDTEDTTSTTDATLPTKRPA